MTMLNRSTKKLLISFLLFLIPGFLIAQSINNDTIGASMGDSTQTSIDFDLLLIGLSYNANNIKYKNLDNSIKMPTYGTDISYYHKSGIWASINFSNYYNASISTYETELQVGYQKTVLEFMDFDFNYGYHYFNGDPVYEGISYQHTINGSLSFNSKYVSFIADAYSMHGLTNNYFTDLGISLNLDIDDLFFKNDFFLFNPGISTSFGTDGWIFEDFTPAQGRGRRYYLSQQGYTTEKFDYLSMVFNVPIIYSYKNISFSFSWFYSIPSNKLKAINWEDQSGFMISVLYTPIF